MIAGPQGSRAGSAPTRSTLFAGEEQAPRGEEHALRRRGASTSQARSTLFAGEEQAPRRRGARSSLARSELFAGEEHALRWVVSVPGPGPEAC